MARRMNVEVNNTVKAKKKHWKISSIGKRNPGQIGMSIERLQLNKHSPQVST